MFIWSPTNKSQALCQLAGLYDVWLMLLRAFLCPYCSDFSTLLSKNTPNFQNSVQVLSIILYLRFVQFIVCLILRWPQRTKLQMPRKQNYVSYQNGEKNVSFQSFAHLIHLLQDHSLTPGWLQPRHLSITTLFPSWHISSSWYSFLLAEGWEICFCREISRRSGNIFSLTNRTMRIGKLGFSEVCCGLLERITTNYQVALWRCWFCHFFSCHSL